MLTNTDYYGNKSYNTESIIHVLHIHYILRSDQNIRGNKTENPCPPKPYVPVLIKHVSKSHSILEGNEFYGKNKIKQGRRIKWGEELKF